MKTKDIPSHIAIAIDWCPAFDEAHPLHATCEACAPLAAKIAAALTAERERCAKIADEYASPEMFKRNMRLAVRFGTDAGAGDALGTRSTARTIAQDIRSLS